MGWGFRKSFKLAPGIRLNVSKSGVSASVGGKGLTYNTRGRLTVSARGTGLRYTVNTKGVARKSADSNLGGIVATAGQSKRERSNDEFVEKLHGRAAKAIQSYFFSHGICVDAYSFSFGTSLPEHSALFARIDENIGEVTTAIKLMNDVGSLSLPAKERAMRALYGIEEALATAHGATRGLRERLLTVQACEGAIPSKPKLNAFWGGAAVLAVLGYWAVFLLFAAAAIVIYGGFKLFLYRQTLAKTGAALKVADEYLDEILEQELTSRTEVEIE